MYNSNNWEYKKVPIIKKQAPLIVKPKNKHSQQQSRDDLNKMVE